MKTPNREQLVRRALLAIEGVCLESDPADKTLGLIYQIAHFVNQEECRKNHWSWWDKIGLTINALKENNVVDVDKEVGAA